MDANGASRAEPSSCSCHLPEGCWGDGGWHFATFTFDGFVRAEILRAVARARGRGRELSHEDRTRARQDAEKRAPHYVGTPYVFEHCEPYRKAVSVEIGRRRAAETVNSLGKKVVA